MRFLRGAIIAAALGLPIFSYAESLPEQNVILITLDGVRWQEVFWGVRMPRRLRETQAAKGDPTFPIFWKKLSSEFLVFGNPEKNQAVHISNPIAYSLAGYQSIYAGRSQGLRCLSNHCGQIREQTFAEKFIEQEIKKEKVAVFSSWGRLSRAIEKKTGTITSDVADRPDADTWSLAMDFLDKNRPRFLAIHLLESDEAGHANDYDKYIRDLGRYDQWLDQLVTHLQTLGAYGQNTSIIVTTDHGSGTGPFWKSHGSELLSSRRVFVLLRLSETLRSLEKYSARESGRFLHADLRPTIENLIEGRGSHTDSCHGYGQSLIVNNLF